MKPHRIAVVILQSALLAAFLYQGMTTFLPDRTAGARHRDRSLRVYVDGDVLRPGYYRVPEGTTRFDILRVAGLRPTSNISRFNLVEQLADNERLTVDTLSSPASLRQAAPQVRLEFFLGDLTITARDGRSRPQQEHLPIDEGDRIQTDVRSQAEVSVNTYSTIDLDDFSELAFDKIGISENNIRTVEMYQRSGTCWYKMIYTSKSELYKIVTPDAVITVAGNGADFMVDIRAVEIVLHNIDGLMLVEREATGEAINLISGQSLTVYRDGRPFLVGRLTPGVDITERFSQLTKEKTNYMLRTMPLNFLFCGLPHIYYLMSIHFDNKTVHVVRVPTQLSIEQFAQGFSQFHEAFLYGGPVFLSTIVEQIMNARVSRHCVFDKNDIVQTAAAIGGISLLIDEKAAAGLNMPAGMRQLKATEVVEYMKPALSGAEDSEDRQARVLKALFDQVGKKILVTALFADQILGRIETNFTTSEVIRYYNRYTSMSGWKFKSHVLPTERIDRKDRIVLEPKLDECRSLLFE